jgi:hypothetical protein
VAMRDGFAGRLSDSAMENGGSTPYSGLPGL